MHTKAWGPKRNSILPGNDLGCQGFEAAFARAVQSTLPPHNDFHDNLDDPQSQRQKQGGNQQALTAFYGPVAIREIYGATEGVPGQQWDERRAWVPNYDLFFFQVETRLGIKMPHEMRPGEGG